MTREMFWAVLLATVLPGPCLAANATHPYANIDPRVDAGNDTGDSQVDQLNQAQLEQGSSYQPPPPREYAPSPAYPPVLGYAAPPAYAPPPTYMTPTYYPPPPYFAPPPAYPAPAYLPPGYGY